MSTKISALTNGSPLQAGDLVVIDRSGASYSATINPGSSGMVDPTAYGVKADARTGADGVSTNASATFTSATGNFTSADVGKLMIVTNTSTHAYPYGTGLVTVLSINSSTSVQLSGNAGAGNGSAQNWALGTDNNPVATPFLSNAAKAAWQANGTLALPSGPMIVSTPPFDAGSTGMNLTQPYYQGFGLVGAGGTNTTTFILHPNVGVGLAATNALFWKHGAVSGVTGNGIGGQLGCSHLRITSLSGTFATSAGATFYDLNYADDIQIQLLYCQPASGHLLSTSGEARYRNLNLQNSYGIYVNMQGQGSNSIEQSILAYNNTAAIQLAGGGVIADITDCYITNCGGSGAPAIQGTNATGNTWNIKGGVFITNGANAMMGDASVGEVWNIHGTNMTGTGATVPIIAVGGTVHLRDVYLKQITAATYGITTGKIHDLGGNNLNGALPSGNFSGTLYGSQSSTGVAQTGGNIVLTTGWATSSVGTISGSSALQQFTITGAGSPLASPVLTITFPVAFFGVPICTIEQIGGTFGVLTNPAITVTNTTATITFAGTAIAAQTYIFVVKAQIA